MKTAIATSDVLKEPSTVPGEEIAASGIDVYTLVEHYLCKGKLNCQLIAQMTFVASTKRAGFEKLEFTEFLVSGRSENVYSV